MQTTAVDSLLLACACFSSFLQTVELILLSSLCLGVSKPGWEELVRLLEVQLSLLLNFVLVCGIPRIVNSVTQYIGTVLWLSETEEEQLCLL